MDHILICGLGSIGRRHLSVCLELGVKRIDCYTTGNSTIKDPVNIPGKIYTDIDFALSQQPTAVIIANPTALHLDTALNCLKHGCHLLIEKPLSHSQANIDKFRAKVNESGKVVTVGFNLRFHPLLIELKKYIRCKLLGRPRFARYHFGAYLPDWHPWEDYRNSYVARDDLGGGSLLTHVHEVDMSLSCFGAYSSVNISRSKISTLDIETDEFSSIIINHKNGVMSSLTLDLGQNFPTRTIDVSFEKGRIQIDMIKGNMSIFSNDHSEKTIILEDEYDNSFSHTYYLQAKSFFRSISTNSQPEVSLKDAIMAQSIISQA